MTQVEHDNHIITWHKFNAWPLWMDPLNKPARIYIALQCCPKTKGWKVRRFATYWLPSPSRRGELLLKAHLSVMKQDSTLLYKLTLWIIEVKINLSTVVFSWFNSFPQRLRTIEFNWFRSFLLDYSLQSKCGPRAALMARAVLGANFVAAAIGKWSQQILTAVDTQRYLGSGQWTFAWLWYGRMTILGRVMFHDERFPQFKQNSASVNNDQT